MGKPNLGRPSEDLVESICNRLFFSDFVVRNPKYAKSDGIEKEISDLLVLFGDLAISIQVKSRARDSNSGETELARLSRTIDKGVRQLKTTKRVLDNQWVSNLITVRGLPIPFNRNVIKKVIGIVIADFHENEIPFEERADIFRGYQKKIGFPIHVFTREYFEEITNEIDTILDFLDFLELREKVYQAADPLSLVNELDLLAAYKMDPDKTNELANFDGVLLLDNFWDHYQNILQNARNKRNEDNKPSLIVDHIISFAHTSVGFDFREYLPVGFEDQQLNTIHGYLQIAREYSSLRRQERKMFGIKFLQCLDKATKNGKAYSLMVDEYYGVGYLILSMKGSRTSRTEYLASLAAMGYVHMGLKKLIGVATEHKQVKHRSYDFVRYEGMRFTNEDELRIMAKGLFGNEYPMTVSEFETGGESP